MAKASKSKKFKACKTCKSPKVCGAVKGCLMEDLDKKMKSKPGMATCKQPRY